MASVGAASVSAGASVSGTEGALDAEKTSGKSENTYILRPVFQQRRVPDGLRRGDLRDCWAGRQSSPGSLGVGKDPGGGRRGSRGLGLKREELGGCCSWLQLQGAAEDPTCSCSVSALQRLRLHSGDGWL